MVVHVLHDCISWIGEQSTNILVIHSINEDFSLNDENNGDMIRLKILAICRLNCEVRVLPYQTSLWVITLP